MCFIDPDLGVPNRQPGRRTNTRAREDMDNTEAERLGSLFGVTSGTDIAGTIAQARKALQGQPEGSKVSQPRATLPGLPLIGRRREGQ